MLREILKRVIRVTILGLGSIFYDKKYLSGRWFEYPLFIDYGVKWIFKGIFYQKIMRINNHIPWPVSNQINIGNSHKIHFDINDLNNFWNFGTFYQSDYEEIFIGKGSYIAQNVGLITANHDIHDVSKHSAGKKIIIGEKCWIGMNSVILPGIILGPHTVVGAGSIVTKSFPDGFCVIAGNPAKCIKKINDIIDKE